MMMRLYVVVTMLLVGLVSSSSPSYSTWSLEDEWRFQHDQTEEAWSAVVLDCPLDSNGTTSNDDIYMNQDVVFAWITPSHHLAITPNMTDIQLQALEQQCVPDKALVVNEDGHLSVLANGSLFIDFFGWGDRGYYQCMAIDLNNNQTRTSIEFYVSLEHHFRNHVYYFSTLYAATAALGFLLLTLIFKLVYFLLQTYGCCLCCCCCENQLPPKAKKIKHALDSIEAYKSEQLERLRENYTQQSDWIRQNCANQMDRVRENYNSQVQNLKDIKQFGTTQIGAVREQYYEQMNRIRDYSTSQLDRVHENYIFQRQRLRKFSAQNYLRVRATGEYTTRTLNRVMENIPPLYLDLTNCRQGMGGRATSIHLPDDFQIAELTPIGCSESLDHLPDLKRVLDRTASIENDDARSSLYYTPTGTPQRELGPNKDAMYTNVSNKAKCHRKSKSFSNFLPTSWPFQWGGVSEDEPQMEAVRVSDPKLQQQRVQAVIERPACGSEDYLNLDENGASKANTDAQASALTTPLLEGKTTEHETSSLETTSTELPAQPPCDAPDECLLVTGDNVMIVNSSNDVLAEEDAELQRIARPEEIVKFIDDPACSVMADLDLGHETFRELREEGAIEVGNHETCSDGSRADSDIERLGESDGIRLRKKSVV